MNTAQTNVTSQNFPPQSQSVASTVFYVDDDTAMCESVSFLIKSIDLTIDTFYSASHFLDTYKPGTPGCLLLDVRMPGMSGLELQEQLHQRKISIPIVFITGHGDMPMAVRAMKLGAVDFLTKPFHDQTLIECIQHALKVDYTQQKYSVAREHIAQRVKTLTPREVEVMQYVVKGDLNKVTGYALGISPKTVELHRSRIMEKMQARSLAHLVKLVLIYDGITEPKKYNLDDAGDHTLSQIATELRMLQ